MRTLLRDISFFGQAIRKHRLPIFVITLVTVLFFWDAIIGRVVVVGPDGDGQYVPWLYYAQTSLASGTFPLWDPYTFSGYPFVSNLQTGWGYPPWWLSLAFTPEYALTWWAILHLWGAALAMYVWAYYHLRDQSSALLAGLVYGIGSGVLSRIVSGQAAHFANLAFVPILGLAITRLVREPTLRSAIFCGAALAVSILPGHPQFSYYVMVLAGGMIIWQGRKDRLFVARVGWLVLAGGLAVVLLAGVLVPFIDLSLHSTERAGGMTIEAASVDTLPPVHVLTIWFPYLFGHPLLHDTMLDTPFGGFHEITLFVGCWAVLLGLSVIIARPSRWTIGWLVAMVVALVAAMGSNTPLYAILFDWFPGWNRFRSIGRLHVVWFMGIALLAGYGWSCVVCQLSPKPLKVFLMLALFVMLGSVGVLCWSWFAEPWCETALAQFYVYNGLSKLGLPFTPTNYTLVVQDLPDGFFSDRLVFMRSQLLQGLGWMTIPLVWGLLVCFAPSRYRFIWNRVLLATLVLELWVQQYTLLPKVPTDQYHDQFHPHNNLIATLQTTQREYRRMMTGDDVLKAAGDGKHPEVYPNRSLVYPLWQVRGYTGVILENYGAYINAMAGREPRHPLAGRLLIPHPDLLDKYQLNLLNVGQILSYHEIDIYPLVKTTEQGLRVYENPDAFPRAFLASPEDARPRPNLELGEVAIQTIDARRAVLSATVNAPALLVYSDVFYPGWQVRVNHHSEQIVAVEDTFKGVHLQPGTHTIEFAFLPRYFIAGLLTSFVAWLCVLVFWLCPGCRKPADSKRVF